MEVDSEHKHCTVYEKCMFKDVAADALAEEWTGYVSWSCDENGKQRFPRKQDILTRATVLLLLSKGHSCCRPGRTRERKHESIHGYIVGCCTILWSHSDTSKTENKTYLKSKGGANCYLTRISHGGFQGLGTYRETQEVGERGLERFVGPFGSRKERGGH